MLIVYVRIINETASLTALLLCLQVVWKGKKEHAE